MSKLESAHKSLNLQVGKYYLVAHAEMLHKHSNEVCDWVCIIPTLHKDGFAPAIPNHYHLDNRFKQSSWARHHYRIYDEVHSNYPVLPSDDDEFGFKIGKIIFKKKKCIRLNTGLTTDTVTPEHDFFKWYNSMQGKSCKGKRCPHFGVNMTEINGQLVCPMHGLIGDIKTETII